MFGFKIIRKKKWEDYEWMRLDYIRLCNEEVGRRIREARRNQEEQNEIKKLPEFPERKHCKVCDEIYYITQKKFYEFKENDFVYELGRLVISEKLHKKEVCADCVKKYKLLDIKKEEKC